MSAAARLQRLILERLSHREGARAISNRGDHDLNPASTELRDTSRSLAPAAVLVPIVVRDDDLSVLFTRRADHLARHAGQVSFPGGRVSAEDANSLHAALRETEEEVGLSRDFVDVVGRLDTYETGTGYLIEPFVGFVRQGFNLKVDAAEVAEVFEVPLPYLLDPANLERKSTVWLGRERRYYAINYGKHYIWGATAGMLVNLHEQLFG